jgi:hypothetical protein
MSREDDLVESLGAALKLERKAPVSDEQLETLEARMGSPLPTAFRALLRRFGTGRMWSVQFDGEDVLFSTVDEMLSSLETMELEGAGVAPFAHDFFGSVWFVKSRIEDPARGGPVVLVPVQERYIDPANPVEHKADTFEDFLRGLKPATYGEE